ncbi:MAG: O-acetyl-ADP-ribose deacetylase [Euryarchaeota archaeon]|nr:O-acetyl-ADP-ribose deacetylase [Euryarchaeota archaeon]
MEHSRISIIKEDIVIQQVDVIVNAANNSLLGGGGVDGAIHRAAGPGLLEECRKLNGCATGEAKITGRHALPASYVIHTVGPVWKGGEHGEDELLSRCYQNCLLLAQEQGFRTIAFPSISTGAYRFPVERASRIVISEIVNFLGTDESIRKVVIVCFNDKAFRCYSEALDDILEHPNEYVRK